MQTDAQDLKNYHILQKSWHDLKGNDIAKRSGYLVLKIYMLKQLGCTPIKHLLVLQQRHPVLQP
jgi:hypothetical protein